MLICIATIWVIWRSRNERMINNVVKESDVMAEDIKVLSWRWSLTRLKCSPCLFYE